MNASTTSSGRQWRARRVLLPLAVAAFAVVGTLGASRGQPERTDLDPLAFALLLASSLSLFWLRSRPVAVLGVVVTLTLTYLLVEYPFGPVFLPLVISVFNAVLMGQRLAAWAGVGVLYVGHFAGLVLLDLADVSLMQMFAVAAWFTVLLVVAEIVRVRRERVAAARQAVEEQQLRQAGEERLRIAQELHDVVAHHISLINVQAGVALHLFEQQPERAETALASIKDASKEALVELRSIVGVLRHQDDDAPRQPAAGLSRLDDLARRTTQAGVEVHTSVHGAQVPLPTGVDLAAFRIIQEALTNVVRHAQASRATVRVGYGDDVLTIQVDDDGRHASPAAPPREGNGITGMRERAAALGGTLRAHPTAEGGFRVLATLPTVEAS